MSRRPIAGERSRSRQPVPAQGLPEPVTPPTAGTRGAAPAPTVVERRPARPARRRATVLLAGALVSLLVLGSTAALLVVRAERAEAVEQARRQALVAAEQHVVTVLSYDHRHLDRDFEAAADVLTGSFAEEYATTAEKVVRPTAEQVKAVVSASVAASSVVRAEPERVVVLLFVDQTTTSTRLDGPKVDLTRVRMTLSKVARDGRDQWLVSGIDAL